MLVVSLSKSPSDQFTRQIQPVSRNEIMRSFVVDGNFTADHIKQKRPDDDVWLNDGTGMMTAREPYASHIAAAKEVKSVYLSCFYPTASILISRQKDPCEPLESSFRAIVDANVGSGFKDVTGVGVHACARHGAYCPGSMVNFQKGERQSNIDYSWSETLKTTKMTGIKKCIHCYDLECIYCKDLVNRFRLGSRFLSMPSHIIIEKAIGMFHVHGHQDSCFFRYATSFIPGAGMVDGEILETLWSVLNKISPTVRTATLAHRSEVLDDHTNDNNWKKIVSIREPQMLLKKPFSIF
jgi:hypothetical protein